MCTRHLLKPLIEWGADTKKDRQKRSFSDMCKINLLNKAEKNGAS